LRLCVRAPRMQMCAWARSTWASGRPVSGVAVSCGGDGGGNGVTAEGAVRQKGNSP